MWYQENLLILILKLFLAVQVEDSWCKEFLHWPIPGCHALPARALAPDSQLSSVAQSPAVKEKPVWQADGILDHRAGEWSLWRRTWSSSETAHTFQGQSADQCWSFHFYIEIVSSLTYKGKASHTEWQQQFGNCFNAGWGEGRDWGRHLFQRAGSDGSREVSGKTCRRCQGWWKGKWGGKLFHSIAVIWCLVFEVLNLS